MDRGLAGGLRAWLEDGVAGTGGALSGGVGFGACGSGAELGAFRPGAPVVVRDGAVLIGTASGRRRAAGVPELRTWLERTVFRLVVTGAHLRHPFEDALGAISVTERGPEVLEAVGRLRSRQRAELRTFVRTRASTIAAQWAAVPPAWLPRTSERLRVPLAGGAAILSSHADLVLGRPSDGNASVCLVQLRDDRSRGDGASPASRARRAVALVETLRSGAPPWRVATYDAGAAQLVAEEVDERLLAGAVRDVLVALGAIAWRSGTGTAAAGPTTPAPR